MKHIRYFGTNPVLWSLGIGKCMEQLNSSIGQIDDSNAHVFHQHQMVLIIGLEVGCVQFSHQVGTLARGALIGHQIGQRRSNVLCIVVVAREKVGHAGTRHGQFHVFIQELRLTLFQLQREICFIGKKKEALHLSIPGQPSMGISVPATKAASVLLS